MEKSSDPDIGGPNVSLLDRVKSIGVSSLDVMPVVGHVKVAVEAVRGRTFGGFELNAFERACYASSVAFTLASYFATYRFLVDQEFLEGGTLGAVSGVGYWTSLVLGKARHTGKVLSVDTLLDAARENVHSKKERVKELMTKTRELALRLVFEE